MTGVPASLSRGRLGSAMVRSDSRPPIPATATAMIGVATVGGGGARPRTLLLGSDARDWWEDRKRRLAARAEARVQAALPPPVPLKALARQLRDRPSPRVFARRIWVAHGVSLFELGEIAIDSPRGVRQRICDEDLVEDIEWMLRDGTTFAEAAERIGLSQERIRHRLADIDRRDLLTKLRATKEDAA